MGSWGLHGPPGQPRAGLELSGETPLLTKWAMCGADSLASGNAEPGHQLRDPEPAGEDLEEPKRHLGDRCDEPRHLVLGDDEQPALGAAVPWESALPSSVVRATPNWSSSSGSCSRRHEVTTYRIDG